MNGKSKCKILKDIRRQIAVQNDIEYVTSECKYQGECSGTCPKCEAEVRYLEEQLRKRQLAGKAIAVAGIAAALVVTAAGCDLGATGGDPLPHTTQTTQETRETQIPGGVPYIEATENTEPLMGDVVLDETEPIMGQLVPDETEPTEPPMGDVVG